MAKKFLDLIDQQELARGKFLYGDALTMPDISLYCVLQICCDNAGLVKREDLPENVTRWFKKKKISPHCFLSKREIRRRREEESNSVEH